MKAKSFRVLFLLPLSGLLSLRLPAQGCAGVPDGRADTGKVNQIPFGGRGPTGPFQNVRYQLLVPASSLPGKGGVLSSLQFASAAAGSYHFDLLEVRVAHLKRKTLSTVFADNLGGAVTVLNKSRWYWNVPKADAWTDLPLEKKFTWDGFRDLVVEVVTQGASCSAANPGFHRSNTLKCIYVLGYDVSRPAKSGYGPFLSGLKVRLCFGGGSAGLTLFGKGCKGSGGKVPLLAAPSPPSPGKSFQVKVTAAPPGAAGLLLLGNDTKKFGSFSLPYSLAGIGAPGCTLYTNILSGLALQAGSTGAASLSIPIPSGTTYKGISFHVQALFLDSKANQAGLVFTQGGTAKIQ